MSAKNIEIGRFGSSQDSKSKYHNSGNLVEKLSAFSKKQS